MQTKKKPILINKSFTSLLVGQTISSAGDTIFDMTLMIWLATFLSIQPSFGPLSISVTLAAELLPAIFLTPFIGVLADRWNSRRTMLTISLFQFVLNIALIPVTQKPLLPRNWLPLSSQQLFFISFAIFLSSTCAQIFNQSKSGLTKDIVEPQHLAKAGGLSQGLWEVAFLFGSLIAAPLLTNFGITWALLTNASTFIIAYITLLLIRVPSNTQPLKLEKQQSFLYDLKVGVRFLIKNKVLSVILYSSCVVCIGFSSLSVLSIFFVINNLHASSTYYGMFGTCIGVGGIVGALFVSIYAKKFGLIKVLSSSILCMSFALFILSRMTQLLPGLIAAFFLGIFVAAAISVYTPLIQIMTPRDLIGKVNSLFVTCNSCAKLVGIICSGLVTSTILYKFNMKIFSMSFGAVDTVFAFASLLALISWIYIVKSLSYKDVALA